MTLTNTTRTTSLIAAFKEHARKMAFDAKNHLYSEFKNKQGLLPAVKKGQFYIEGTVDFGTREGDGQFRIVILCEYAKEKINVLKKYYSKNHYGTGTDAGKSPAFVLFR